MLKTKTITTDKATVLVVECPKTYSLFHDDDWELIGRLPDITEGQWKDVVDDYDNGYFYYPDGYKDTCDTATESGLSLLQANEVYFENKKPWEKDVLQRIIGNMLDKDAQSKVFDKERTFLFIKGD